MQILKYMPNTFTALNLTSGCLGLLSIYEGDLFLGAMFILIGAVFDFLDGFTARILETTSEIGKQLDSLADLATFGMVLAFMMYYVLEEQGLHYISLVSLLLVVSSAFRLARFNIDESQKMYFKGLPTPANAFLVAGIIFAREADWKIFSFIYDSIPSLIIFIIVLSFLLNAPFSFLSFKIKTFSFRGNEYILMSVIVSLMCVFLFGLKGIFPATVFYMFFSLLRNLFMKGTSP